MSFNYGNYIEMPTGMEDTIIWRCLKQKLYCITKILSLCSYALNLIHLLNIFLKNSISVIFQFSFPVLWLSCMLCQTFSSIHLLNKINKNVFIFGLKNDNLWEVKRYKKIWNSQSCNNNFLLIFTTVRFIITIINLLPSVSQKYNTCWYL